VVLLGVALPLLVLERLERRDHKPAHRRRHQMQIQMEEAVETMDGVHDRRSPGDLLPGPPSRLCAIELLLLSCLSWRVACLSVDALQFISLLS